MTKKKKEIPVILNLSTDLKFLHGDTRQFTRKEALRAMMLKFQILKDFTHISQYLESIVTSQGEEYFLVDSKRPAESLEELFKDLKALARSLPPFETLEWMEWRLILGDTLKALHNSAFFFAYGTYWLSTHQKEANEMVNGWLDALSSEEPEIVKEKASIQLPEDGFLSIPEVADILGCSRETVYKKHIQKQGLMTVKPTGGHQKVLKTALDDYIKRIGTKAA